MNTLIKTLLIAWLFTCATVAWVMCALVGFGMLFTNINYLSWITPFIGVTFLFCITYVIIRVKNSNPMGFIKRVREIFGGQA